MLNIVAAAGVAARWLGIDAREGHDRLEEVEETPAVYLRAHDGRAALVDGVGRVLLADPEVPFPVHLADFRAGWRSDYVARPA